MSVVLKIKQPVQNVVYIRRCYKTYFVTDGQINTLTAYQKLLLSSRASFFVANEAVQHKVSIKV